MKKLLTLTLSLLMAFSLCLTISAQDDDENSNSGNDNADTTSTIVAKANNKEYTTLQEAINDEGITEVELQCDITESITVNSGKNITLKLNGKTLTANNKDAIYVANGASLTIIGQGGKVVATKGSYAAIFNNGNTTLTDCGEYLRDGSSKWYIIVNHGTMEIKDSKIESTNQTDTSSAIENGYSNYNSNNERSGYVKNTNQTNPTLTIDNANVSTYGCNAVKNDDGGVLTINNGDFETKNKSDGSVILNWNEATINNGKFTAANTLSVISNGHLNDTVNKGMLAINNGTFVQQDNNPLFAYGVGSSNGGTVNVYNGTFTGKIANSITYILKISGGTFKSDVSGYLASDYTVIDKGDGSFDVVKKGEPVNVDTTTAAITSDARTALNGKEIYGDGTGEDQVKITVDSSTQLVLKAEKQEVQSPEELNYVLKEAIGGDISNLKYIPLEITLEAVTDNGNKEIHSLGSNDSGEVKIPVTLYLTDADAKALSGKDIKVIRIHEGDDEVIKILPATLNGNILTFESGKFSTYLITYRETSSNTNNTSTKSYDAKDKNKDGVVSCEEEMNSANWIWSTTKNACVYKVTNTSAK